MPDYKWKKLGAGNYNVVYVNQDRTLVLKCQKSLKSNELDLDNAERSVRLWNEINPDIIPKAFVYGYKDDRGRDKIGWVAPYIEGKQASDEEIAAKVLEIYMRTGRILVDACSPENFIRTKAGKIVCVDIGLGLQLEEREEKNRSFTSLAMWQNSAPRFTQYFHDQTFKYGYPKTVAMIKALLVLQNKSPDLDVQQLQSDDPAWVARFSADYKAPLKKDKSWRELALKQGRDERAKAEVSGRLAQAEESFKDKQDFCIKRLSQYVLSRGSIDYRGNFKPSLMTRIFRNKKLTEEKVQYARNLIYMIKKEQNEAKLNTLLHTGITHEDSHFFKAGRLAQSDLERAVKACQFELQIIGQRKEDKEEMMLAPPTKWNLEDI